MQKGTQLATVQGIIQRELSRLAKASINVTSAGRTDTGVHARGQVINFYSGNWLIPTDRVIYALNSVLPFDIRALSAEEVPDSFHARYSAVAKTYSYYICREDIVSPFTRLYSYHNNSSMDLMAMRRAAQYLIGEHDFRSFMASGSSVKTTVRKLFQLDLLEKDGMIILTYCGNGFLYNMVRIITGTLLLIGTGKKHYSVVEEILNSCDRRLAGPTLPAHGLFLEKVEY